MITVDQTEIQKSKNVERNTDTHKIKAMEMPLYDRNEKKKDSIMLLK